MCGCMRISDGTRKRRDLRPLSCKPLGPNANKNKRMPLPLFFLVFISCFLKFGFKINDHFSFVLVSMFCECWSTLPKKDFSYFGISLQAKPQTFQRNRTPMLLFLHASLFHQFLFRLNSHTDLGCD